MKGRNLKLIVSLAIVAVVAIVLLIVGYALSGVDLAAWLGSKYAVTLYIFVGIYGIVVLIITLHERNKRL